MVILMVKDMAVIIIISVETHLTKIPMIVLYFAIKFSSTTLARRFIFNLVTISKTFIIHIFKYK